MFPAPTGQTPQPSSNSGVTNSQQTFQSLTVAPPVSSGVLPQGTTPATATVNHLQRGIVKLVLSGDAIVVRGQPKGGPPPEKQINLTNITAPKLARRPTDANSSDSKDEPCAWEAREFLRKKLVGQEVVYSVQYTVPATGREYGIVYLGKDNNGENVAESLVAEGLAEVRQGVKAGDEFYQRLNELQNAAKASGKGKWASDASVRCVRDVKWTVDNARHFVDTARRQPFAAVVEHVRDGSTLRAFLLPDFHYVTVMLTGIKCPGYKIEDNKVQEGEQYADEAKFFVESRLLQRDVSIILESASNQNFVGSVLHPKGNIAEALLNEGFAKCVDWSLAVLTESAERYRAAEKLAKEKRLRLWKSYQPPQNSALSGGQAGKTFQAKVVEIVMADAVVVKKGENDYQKIWFSSIRPPRSEETGAVTGKENQRPEKFRPLFDIPYMFEAREFLRKKLIGKKVTVTVDYVQPAFENFPEKTCCTVTIGGQNVAEALVAKGLATVIRYAQGNENRSSQYDQLMSAEAKAEKSRKGLHSLKLPSSEAALLSQSKDAPFMRVQDSQGDPAKAKQFYPFLQRASRLEAVVEFVASGSRFRLLVPKETCLLSFLLSGISCPRASRANLSTGSAEAEPFGDEALQFIKEMCLQREIEIEIETMDKAGNIIGYAFFDGKNLSELLVERGLAKVHQFSASRSKYQAALNSSQERARAEKLNIWTLPENAADMTSADEKLADDDEIDAEQDGKSASDLPARVVDYKDVMVIDVLADLRFYAQSVDQGPKLERMMSDLRAELALNVPVPGSFNPRKGELCAAIFSADDQWYRARVESVMARDRCDVVYIDFGNRETVDITRLAALPTSFHRIPPGIKEYHLAYVRLPDDATDANAAVEFISQQIIAVGQRLLLNSEYRANGLEHATLTTSTDKQDLGKLLVAQGYALVEMRRDRRLQAILQEYKQAQESAKANRALQKQPFYISVKVLRSFKSDDSSSVFEMREARPATSSRHETVLDRQSESSSVHPSELDNECGNEGLLAIDRATVVINCAPEGFDEALRETRQSGRIKDQESHFRMLNQLVQPVKTFETDLEASSVGIEDATLASYCVNQADATFRTALK